MSNSSAVLAPNQNPIADNSSSIKNNPFDPNRREKYDSTRLLIVFIIVVFIVLILFILIYYYFVKRMKATPITRQTQKSTSGSITDEKARNIFAHPERQLAVDQSTRASASPTSQASADGGAHGQADGGAGAGGTIAPIAAAAAAPPPATTTTSNVSATGSPVSGATKAKAKNKLDQPQQQRSGASQLQPGAPIPPLPPIQPAGGGAAAVQPQPIPVSQLQLQQQMLIQQQQQEKKSKSKSDSRGRDMTVTGTLANLRETLKRTGKGT